MCICIENTLIWQNAFCTPKSTEEKILMQNNSPQLAKVELMIGNNWVTLCSFSISLDPAVITPHFGNFQVWLLCKILKFIIPLLNRCMWWTSVMLFWPSLTCTMNVELLCLCKPAPSVAAFPPAKLCSACLYNIYSQVFFRLGSGSDKSIHKLSLSFP